MLEERAKILSVESGRVWVSADRSQGCAKCEAGEGCGGGMLTKLVKRKAARIEVRNELADICKGDEVVIGLNEKVLLKSSVVAYFVPLAGLFTGALIAEFFMEAHDLIVAAMGMIGLAAGFLIFRQFSASTITDKNYQPVVLRKATNASGGCQVYVVKNDD